MSSHAKKKCKNCSRIYEQCRCASLCFEVIEGVCDDCQKLVKPMGMWKGKRIEDLSKEEMLEVIKFLVDIIEKSHVPLW